MDVSCDAFSNYKMYKSNLKLEIDCISIKSDVVNN